MYLCLWGIVCLTCGSAAMTIYPFVVSVLTLLNLPCRHFVLKKTVMSNSEDCITFYLQRGPCDLAALGHVEAWLRDLAQELINSLNAGTCEHRH